MNTCAGATPSDREAGLDRVHVRARGRRRRSRRWRRSPTRAAHCAASRKPRSESRWWCTESRPSGRRRAAARARRRRSPRRRSRFAYTSTISRSVVASALLMIEITGRDAAPAREGDDRDGRCRAARRARSGACTSIVSPGASMSFIQFDITPVGHPLHRRRERVAGVGRARHRVAADDRLAVDRRPGRCRTARRRTRTSRASSGGISRTNERVSAVSSMTSTTVERVVLVVVQHRISRRSRVAAVAAMISPYPILCKCTLEIVLVSFSLTVVDGGCHVRSEVTWPTIPAMVRDAGAPLRRRRGGRRRRPPGRLHRAARRWSTDAARALLASGIEPGDRVAVWAPNSLEWIVAALGVTTAGGVLVPVNTRFRAPRPRTSSPRSGARVLFTVRGFLDTDYPALLAERRRRRSRARAHGPARRATPTTTARRRGTTFLARGDARRRRGRPRRARRVASGPTTRATSCSRRARPATPRAS